MIRLENINKYFFKNKKNQIHVINDTSLELPEKGLVTLLGPSGSGKTTLLNVIGGLDSFESGTLTIDDLKLTKSNYKKIESIRNTDIGYVFQDYKLIDDMTVFQNVALSLKMCGIKDKDEITKRVNEILELLGIYRYRNRKSAMLSGGERQRVSIARAIVKNPRIVICDEPTGNLDSKKTVEIMNILKAISKTRLVLLVSHESDIAKFYSDQIIEIKDGKITANYQNSAQDELDYEVANKIYLKDMKNHYSFKEKNIDVNVYSNEDEKLKIKLVIRNNNIYIETDNVDNVELINKESSFELLDEHYKGLNKSTIDEQEFNIEEIPNKKRTSIYNVFTMLKVGWLNLLHTNRFKRLTLFCAALASALVLYASSVYLGAKEIHKEDYLLTDESYLEVKFRDDSYEEYKKLEKREDVINIETNTYMSNIAFPLAVYYQAQMYDDFSFQVGISSIDLIDEDDIIYGTLPKNDDEVVLDLSIYESDEVKSTLRMAGIVSVEDLIGKPLSNDWFLHGRRFTITGITDKKNNSIYHSNKILRQINLVHANLTHIDLYDNYKDEIRIISGEIPDEFNEALLPEKLATTVNIGGEYSLDGRKYKVTGFYKPESNSWDPIYVNDETLISLTVQKNNRVYVSVKDKDAFISEFKDKYTITDLSKESFDRYDLERKSHVATAIASAAILIIITLVFVVLMTRASFLSRIKEVGIMRAVGVSKMDLYRMFMGESLVIIGLSGLAGTSFMYYILSMLAKTNFFDFGIVVNPIVAIVSYILLVVFYVIVVLIPVFFVLRKTPAAILSRKDV